MSQSLAKRSQRQLERVTRNIGPLSRSLWALFRSNDPEAREEALRKFVHWIGRKRIDPWRAEGKSALKGFALEYLQAHPEQEARMDRTHHLGMLEELGFAQASRLDYMYLQARNLLALKKAHKNLGLSSPVLKVRDRTFTGLEVAQLWASLFNVGHLFGTFATERGLLFHIREREDLREQLISNTDSRLRANSRAILEESRIYQCAQALAAWEVSQDGNADHREIAIEAILAYRRLDPDPRIQKLKWVYRRVRQFSYLQLHGPLGIGLQQGFTVPDETLAELIGHPSFTYEAHARHESEFAKLFDSIDEFQYRSFFTSPAASLAVLAHLRAFKRWWRRADECSMPIQDRVKNLFTQPPDWPEVGADELRHICRVELDGSSSEWLREAQSWHAAGAPWQDSNFLLTYVPGVKGLLCDVYAATEVLPPSATAHVLSQLGRHSERSWQQNPNEVSRRLWRSVAAFGISLFNQALKDDIVGLLAPAAATNGSIGYAIAAHSSARLLERLRHFLENVTDDVRRSELLVLAEDIETHSHDDVTLAFLGAVKLFDSKGSALGEIDGLWVAASGAQLVWRALEVKSGNKTRGVVGQLEKIRGHLRVSSSELEIRSSNGSKSSVTQFELQGGSRITQHARETDERGEARGVDDSSTS